MSRTSRALTNSSALDPGKPGEVADVRKARDEQPVDMGRREPVGERRQSATTRISHGRRACASAREAPARSRMLRDRRRRRPPRARASSGVAPARARTRSSDAPRRTAPRPRVSASRIARLVCVYAPALITTPSTCPRSAWIASIDLSFAVVLRELDLGADLLRRRRATTARCRRASRGRTAPARACREDSGSGR